MSERLYQDIFGKEVVLTDSVREMIVVKHPEATDFIGKIDQVLAQPDEVRRSVRDARVVLYYRFDASVLGGKRIVVVVKRVDRHFVSTVYATDQIKSGEVIWIKNT